MILEQTLVVLFDLLRKTSVSNSELAEEFSFRSDNVAQYIQWLQKSGLVIKVTAEDDPKYTLSTNYIMYKKYLTLDQLISVRNVVMKSDEPLSHQDLVDFLHLIDAQARVLDSDHISQKPMFLDEILETVATAYQGLSTRRVIHLQYTDVKYDQTVRDVEPLELFFQNNTWYLWAFCLLRDDLRTFKLKSTDDINLTYKKYIRRPFDLEDGTSDPREFQDRYFVTFELDKSLRSIVKQKFDHDKILNLPDKIVILEKDLYDPDYALAWLSQFGDKVTVALPEDLQAKLSK